MMKKRILLAMIVVSFLLFMVYPVLSEVKVGQVSISSGEKLSTEDPLTASAHLDGKWDISFWNYNFGNYGIDRVIITYKVEIWKPGFPWDEKITTKSFEHKLVPNNREQNFDVYVEEEGKWYNNLADSNRIKKLLRNLFDAPIKKFSKDTDGQNVYIKVKANFEVEGPLWVDPFGWGAQQSTEWARAPSNGSITLEVVSPPEPYLPSYSYSISGDYKEGETIKIIFEPQNFLGGPSPMTYLSLSYSDGIEYKEGSLKVRDNDGGDITIEDKKYPVGSEIRCKAGTCGNDNEMIADYDLIDISLEPFNQGCSPEIEVPLELKESGDQWVKFRLTSHTPSNVPRSVNFDEGGSTDQQNWGVIEEKIFVEQKTGSLEVAIEPSGARDAGAQWRVQDRDGNWSDWFNSGHTETGLPVGDYRVEYKNISGWDRPSGDSGEINANRTSRERGSYREETGSLEVTIKPREARNAGAQWRVRGPNGNWSSWFNSGYTETDLPIGSYTVDYKDISGWTEPDNHSGAIYKNQTATESGTYEQNPQLAVSPTSHDFETITQGNTPSKTFNIENTGGGTLDWKVSSSPSWLSVSNTSGTNSGSFTATVKSGASLGFNSGSIQVNSNGGSEDIQVEVNVEETTHIMDLDIQGQGEVTVTTDGNSEGTYTVDTEIEIADGASVDISTTPDTGWGFDGFSGDNPPFTMNSNKHTTATFTDISAEGTLNITPSTVTLPPGSTTSFDVNISGLTNGLERVNVDLEIGSNCAADLTGVSSGDLPGFTYLTTTDDISSDGKSVTLSAYTTGTYSGSGNTVYSLEVTGKTNGNHSCPIIITKNSINDQDGNDITANVTTQEGTLEITGGPPAAPGKSKRPKDLNSSGNYEDVNGNGNTNYHDYIFLARLVEGLVKNGPAYINNHGQHFDFTGNGSCNYRDYIKLARIVEGLDPGPASLGQSQPTITSYSRTGTLKGEPYRLVLTKAPEGLSVYKAKLSTEQGKINGINLTTLTGIGSRITSSNKSAQVAGVDFREAISGTGKEVELGRIWADNPGQLNVKVQKLIDDEDTSIDKDLLEVKAINEPLQIERVLITPNPAVNTNKLRFWAEGQGIAEIGVQVFQPNGELIYNSGFVKDNSATWDLTGISGEPVPNGLYLCAVTAKGFEGETTRSELRRVLVLR